MKIKSKLRTATALAVACSALGCSRQTTKTETESLPDLSKRAQQELAQGYFRLGVSVSARLMRQHDLNGEPTPPPAEFLKVFDIAASNGETLLKAP